MRDTSRNLIAALLALTVVGGPTPVFGQSAPIPDPIEKEQPRVQRPEKTEAAVRSDLEVRAIRNGVQKLYDAYHGQRLQRGWSSVISGVLAGGIGTYFLVLGLEDENDPNAPAFALLGTGLAGLGLGEMVRGVWNLLDPNATEAIAAKILNDRKLIASSGMLFLEQEARRARRERLLGGTLQMANGVTTGLLIIPFRHFSDQDSADLITIFLGAAALVSVGSGIFQLFGESFPEEVYRRTKQNIGGPTAGDSVQLSPAILSNGDEESGYGLKLSYTWK